MVSVPQSKANYSYLYQLLHDYTRFTYHVSPSLSIHLFSVDEFIAGRPVYCAAMTTNTAAIATVITTTTTGYYYDYYYIHLSVFFLGQPG